MISRRPSLWLVLALAAATAACASSGSGGGGVGAYAGFECYSPYDPTMSPGYGYGYGYGYAGYSYTDAGDPCSAYPRGYGYYQDYLVVPAAARQVKPSETRHHRPPVIERPGIDTGSGSSFAGASSPGPSSAPAPVPRMDPAPVSAPPPAPTTVRRSGN